MITSENKIIVECSSCKKKFGLKSDKYMGRKIKCPKCGNPILVHQKQEDLVQQNPEAEQNRNSLSRRASVAAILLIACYFIFGNTTVQKWFSGAESGEAIKFDPEKQKFEEYLADCLIDSLDINSGEKKEINNIVKVMSSKVPEILPKSEISEEQQRTNNIRARDGHYRINKLLKASTDKKNLHVKVSEENTIDDALYAFCWKKQDIYRKLWIKAVLHKITQNPEEIDILKLLDDLCYIEQTDFQKHPGLAAIISFAFKKTMDMKCRNKSDYIEKMCCLHYLQNSEEECMKKIIDTNIPFGNLNQRGKGYRLLMKYIVLKGGSVDRRLLKFTQKYSQDMAILLEADGCLPQIDGVNTRINLRESVYWASRLFDRDDFRFIAFGGLRMPKAFPPSICSVYLPELSKCVMRSTWNICYHIKDDMRRKYGDDQASLTMDLNTGDISIYGYNHPQCIIRNQNYGELDNSKTLWKSEDDRDHLHVETSSRIMDIYFIKGFNTWIVKDRILSGSASQDIHFYRSEINYVGKNTLLSEHYVRLTWEQDVQMANKQAGNVYLKSSAPFIHKEVAPEIEGCYYKVNRNLSGETELIITAMPYFCPEKYKYCSNRQYIRKNINFPLVKKVSDTDYSCFFMKRNQYHKSFTLDDSLDSKQIFSLSKKLAKK